VTRPLLNAIRVLALAMAALAAGCADFPKLSSDSDKPKPVSPQITEQVLRERAHEQLALGVKQYNAGEYENALKSLQASLDHGLTEKTEQSTARKHLAFIHCVTGREGPCREEFRKAFEIDSNFSLSAAEDGHPIWGPIYRSVRSQLIAEREAAQSRPRIALGKAEQMLADGMVKYESGDIAEAQKLFEASLAEGLRDKADTVRAMKQVAFCMCLQGHYPLCRAQFLKIYDVEPAFDLTPAEAGHPSWTKTFASAKALAKKAQEDKLAKENADAAKAAAKATTKDKPPATPPTASTPAKKSPQ
jgi:tetratricopeptide (TPR) repeat protein